MVIREMSEDECLQQLAGARLFRLACAQENQPYIVPVYLAYHAPSRCLYGFTTPGQKIEWMRANPLVCVEIDESPAFDQWTSVIVSGRYEELSHAAEDAGARGRTPERSEQTGRDAVSWDASDRSSGAPPAEDDEQRLPWSVFKDLPMWWQPGSAVWTARAHRDPVEPFTSVFYRIRIGRVTGHAATRDAGEQMPRAAPDRSGWLGKTVTRVFGSAEGSGSNR